MCVCVAKQILCSTLDLARSPCDIHGAAGSEKASEYPDLLGFKSTTQNTGDYHVQHATSEIQVQPVTVWCYLEVHKLRC